MQQSDVIGWLLDECESLLNTSSVVAVSAPSDHVDVADAFDESTYPFIGVQKISNTPESAGIGADTLFVDSILTDADGNVTSITYYGEPTLRVSVEPVTDDDAADRDGLADEITDHFGLIVRNDGEPADITVESIGEATPSDRTDDLVRADGVPIELSYERYVTDTDVDAAETVTLGLDVSEDETFGDADDETALSDTL
jgi:hypothetical protein